MKDLEKRIKDFKKRIEIDGKDFCEELYVHATIRLLAHKYAYYIESKPYIEDVAYDHEEKSWYVMGRALGVLTEDKISPCIDFDPNHPLADLGIELAKRLIKKKGI